MTVQVNARLYTISLNELHAHTEGVAYEIGYILSTFAKSTEVNESFLLVKSFTLLKSSYFRICLIL